MIYELRQGKLLSEIETIKQKVSDEAKKISQNRWRTVRFDEMAQLVNDRIDNPAESGVERYVGLEHLDSESLKIRRLGKPSDVEAQKLRFQPGDIIFGKRRAYQRKVAVADFEGICSAHAMVLRAREETIVKDFLPFFMQSETFFERALSISVGSLSPTINWKSLAEQKFTIPPKDEQRRIAEILWAVDEVVSRYQKCANETMFLQQVFMESRLSVESSHESWQTVTLADVCFVQSGQVNPTVEPYLNMIHIAPDDIESQTGRILEKKTAAEDRITSGKYEFKSGAILYNKIRPNLQKVALPDFDGVCSADVYPVYAKENVIQKLLFYVLLSEEFTKYAVANSVRSAIPKLNREAMMKYSFKLPPLQVQERIVEALDSIATSLQEIENHKKQSQILKNELIKKLLFKNQ